MSVKVLTFLGDVFLPRAYRVTAAFDAPVVFNLEYPITSASTGWPGKVNLKANASHIAETFGRLPAAVCLANNHIMDFGAQGLQDTRAELLRLRIGGFGAGTRGENAGNPYFLPHSNVALLGYACPSTAAVLATSERAGAAPLDVTAIGRDIAAAKSAGAMRVIVSLHWGEEEVFLPKPGDVATARSLIDAGADLIIGHHAHCAQPFERYLGKFIFYGLGNCIFPDLDEPSYFDETGRPARRFVKKQHWWNRRSLAVDYDVESSSVGVRALNFDGKTLAPAPFHAGRYRMPAVPDAMYSARYRRAFSYGKLRCKVMTYARSPRPPRMRHLKSILAIAREVTAARS